MRLLFPSLLIGMNLGAAVQAALISEPFTGGFVNGVDIPDGNAVGWSDPRNISGLNTTSLSDLTVKINLTGGFNGDLYAYVSHDGILVPLLNRVGVTATPQASAFGYGEAGFAVAFSASAAADAHFYNRHQPTLVAGQLTGTWQPDGRAIDPLSAPDAFDAATAHRISLDAFNGLDPNGNWTLFIADLSSGGQSRVQSWGLNFTIAPPPNSNPPPNTGHVPDAGSALALLGLAWLGMVFPRNPGQRAFAGDSRGRAA
jgi:hypothetical protein